MAFIDSGMQASAFGGINPGAPSGSGIPNSQAASTGNSVGQSGSGGPGAGYSNKSWALIYLLLIAGTLICTGVIFNGKGRG